MTQPIAQEDALGEATEVLDSLLIAWRRITPDATLSRTAAGTLGALRRFGPMRLTALASHESVTQPAMTGLIGRLAAQGLVNRTPDPSDGRAVLIGITPRGEAVVQRRRQQYAETISEALRTLPDPDLDRLVGALPALRRLADAAHRRTEQNPEAHR